MKKRAKDLKPGDVVLCGVRSGTILARVYPDGRGCVAQVHTERDCVFAIFDGFTWDSFPADAEVEVEPRTIPASDVKPGMTVRLEGTNIPMVVERVVSVGSTKSRVYLLGVYKKGGAQVWHDIPQHYQCEVIE